MKIISRGRVCSIVLIDNENKIFAVCYASEDGAVERTLDSGRYFVLRITNQQGRHAFIGIAFNERNDAFDFNVTLSEFKNEIEREDQANKLTLESTSAIVQPLKDMSLKDGEKIKIKLTSSSKKKNDENPAGIGNKSTLLPPPRGGATPAVTAPTTSTAPTAPKASSTLNNSPSIKSSQPIFNADPFNSDPFSTDPFSASSSNAQSSTNVFSFGSASSSASSLLSSDPFTTKSDPFASNNDPFSSNSDPFQTTTTTTTTTGTATTSYNNKQSSSTTSSSSSNLLDF